MKGLVILASGFEDTEALATIDILKRAKIEVTTASVTDSLEVVTQYKHKLFTSSLLKDLNLNDYDFLVLPGGGAVFNILDYVKEVDEVIKFFIEKERLVCAICAAPHLLGKNGYLQNKNYTCFPGCEDRIIGGNKLNDGVVVDGNIITAKSMYYSIDFGLAIVKKSLGINAYETVLKAIKGEK